MKAPEKGPDAPKGAEGAEGAAEPSSPGDDSGPVDSLGVQVPTSIALSVHFKEQNTALFR